MFEVPALPIPRLARVSVGAYRHTRLERGAGTCLTGVGLVTSWFGGLLESGDQVPGVTNL